jgi:hypothetical protein
VGRRVGSDLGQEAEGTIVVLLVERATGAQQCDDTSDLGRREPEP